MMAGLKSPTINRQDRQTTNAIKRNPSPNEIRTPTPGIGPKPQNDRIAKSKATAVHSILINVAHPGPYPPLSMFGDDRLWALDEARAGPGSGSASGRRDRRAASVCEQPPCQRDITTGIFDSMM